LPPTIMAGCGFAFPQEKRSQDQSSDQQTACRYQQGLFTADLYENGRSRSTKYTEQEQGCLGYVPGYSQPDRPKEI
jgi:hypothetical protein